MVRLFENVSTRKCYPSNSEEVLKCYVCRNLLSTPTFAVISNVTSNEARKAAFSVALICESVTTMAQTFKTSIRPRCSLNFRDCQKVWHSSVAYGRYILRNKGRSRALRIHMASIKNGGGSASNSA